MSEAPLHYKTITEVAGLIEGRDLSPVEVTGAMLERINDLDGHLKSYATVMADHALQSARRAEREIAAGEYRGPLHGVPIAVKDLCFTKGVRTMGGAKVYADHVPEFDSTVVERLEAAGAVLLGKLNLTEGAMGGYNPEFQVPLNPWDSGRWSGASSSGSGVATAAGLCFGSLGSDTGGSIRFPASACGIVGLKPTWGRVSRYGVLRPRGVARPCRPDDSQHSRRGYHAPSDRGPYDSNDATTLSDPVPNIASSVGDGVRGVRIGVDEHHVSDSVDPEVTEAVLQGVRAYWKRLGAEVVEVRMPDVDRFTSRRGLSCAPRKRSPRIARTIPPGEMTTGRGSGDWLDMGAAKSGADYAEANNMRAECNGLVREVFKEIDLMACPSMLGPAHPVTPEMMYGPMDRRVGTPFQRYTIPYDFNGTPTLTVPCGLSSDGLPLSLQIVGKHLSEPLLCRVGHAYEQATEWHNLRPPLTRVVDTGE